MKENAPAPKPLIILSGPPGAGKSTSARQLRALSPETTSLIEGDDFWSFFPVRPRNTRNKGDFRILLRSAVGAAAVYAAGGYETILDFSVPPWYLDAVRRIAGARGVAVDYVVLLAEEQTCAARAAERPYGAIEDYGAFHDFYLSFCGTGRHEISGDNDSPQQLAAAIREGLDACRFRLD